jgi:prevent-host-death family protein
VPAVLDPVPTDAAPAAFNEAVARAESGKERIILTRAGKPVAALVPIADLEAIEDAEDKAAAAEALVEYDRSGNSWPTFTVEDLAAQWGIDPSDNSTK